MKKETKNNLIIVSLLLLVIVSGLLGGMIGYNRAKAKCQTQTGTVSDTTWFTLTEEIPVPSPPDTVTKVVTKVVQVPLTDVEVDTDVDSARITLPFEQHHAQLGDVADVWYSGYDAKIDSATIYKHQQTVIEQHYITQPSPSNIIGLEAGAKDASLLYIHRFGKVHVGFSAGSTYEGQPTARGFIGIQF